MVRAEADRVGANVRHVNRLALRPMAHYPGSRGTADALWTARGTMGAGPVGALRYRIHEIAVWSSTHPGEASFLIDGGTLQPHPLDGSCAAPPETPEHLRIGGSRFRLLLVD